MTPLRQRMLDALILRGLADRTQESYLEAVSRLARHYGRGPDRLTALEVQQYLLHLLRERHLARSSVNQYGCAYRFLYGTVLGLDAGAFQIPLARAPQRLPEILSRAELAQLFAAARSEKSRTFLMVTYGTGLRLSEICHLRVEHIDSHVDRICIRVEQGKGAKDLGAHDLGLQRHDHPAGSGRGSPFRSFGVTRPTLTRVAFRLHCRHARRED